VVGDDERLTLLLRNGNRHNLLSKATGLLSGDSALVTAQGKSILIGAADIVASCHILGGLAHAVGVMEGGELWIDEAPAERCVLKLHIAREGAIALAQHK